MTDSDPVQLKKMVESISANERVVLLAAFDAILASAPASLQFLSQRTGLAPVVVADATNHLVDLGLLACNEAGLVVGSWGLTLVPTSHQLRMLGGSYYTWCAEDAVGIPAALNVDAAIASSCFQCGQKVAIELEHGEVVKAMPQDRVIDGKRRMIKRWQNGKSSCGGWWHRRS